MKSLNVIIFASLLRDEGFLNRFRQFPRHRQIRRTVLGDILPRGELAFAAEVWQRLDYQSLKEPRRSPTQKPHWRDQMLQDTARPVAYLLEGAE